jgi:hypothetical protein
MLFMRSPEYYTLEYYTYVADLIRKICVDEHIDFDINLGLPPRQDVMLITINHEHTLTDTLHDHNVIPTGGIPVIHHPDRKYLVKLDNFYLHSLADIMIDYSIPNIRNLESSSSTSAIAAKSVYIAPILYPVCEEQTLRTIDTLTTFAFPELHPRRKQLLEKLGPTHVNRTNCFGKEELFDLYKSTKVILNIHQKEWHHTAEELRILPALACGVIVISEDSPLKETIPYHDSVIWVPYDQIISKAKEVLADYENYRKPLDRLKTLHQENYDRLRDKIMTNSRTLDILSNKYHLDKNIATKWHIPVSRMQDVWVFKGGRIVTEQVEQRGVTIHGSHDYIPAYTAMFGPVRSSVRNLLEIGIGSVENGQMVHLTSTGYKTGNSLRCWRDYFPNARIHGIDIYSHSFTEPRITTYVADQSNTSQLDEVIKTINEPLDIIIDDGSHDGSHQVISFMHLEQYLSPTGIYVIEDVQPATIPSMQDLSAFPEVFRAHIRESYSVQLFDTRAKSGKVDDFMISFTRKH